MVPHAPAARAVPLHPLQIGDALDDGAGRHETIVQVDYFTGENWYRPWFHWLEALLIGSGAGSYLDGSACHLDLVQWATKPVQRKLSSEVWGRLVQDDLEFLRWQLLMSNVSVVLMNGASVVCWVAATRAAPSAITGGGEAW
jgi:hypothetical protein